MGKTQEMLIRTFEKKLILGLDHTAKARCKKLYESLGKRLIQKIIDVLLASLVRAWRRMEAFKKKKVKDENKENGRNSRVFALYRGQASGNDHWKC